MPGVRHCEVHSGQGRVSIALRKTRSEGSRRDTASDPCQNVVKGKSTLTSPNVWSDFAQGCPRRPPGTARWLFHLARCGGIARKKKKGNSRHRMHWVFGPSALSAARPPPPRVDPFFKRHSPASGRKCCSKYGGKRGCDPESKAEREETKREEREERQNQSFS